MRSKSSQLEEFLRQAIEHGGLPDPLPGTREWSRQLGVGRRTLNAAIATLRREGWLHVHSRGTRVVAAPRGSPLAGPRRVHVLLFAAYRKQIHNYLELIGQLQDRLHQRGFELQWETCTPARLREIARRARPGRELLLLASLPPAYQRLFAASHQPACVFGERAEGVALPFINVDQTGAVRHAAFRLLQHGARELVLVHVAIDSAGMRSTREVFRAACAEWTHGSVACRTVGTALDAVSLLQTARKLAREGHTRRGYIVLAPVPVGLIVTSLLRSGVALPQQAEVAALFHSPDSVKLDPAPIHYPFPVRQAVKEISDVAGKFFSRGEMPAVAKTIPAEVAEGR